MFLGQRPIDGSTLGVWRAASDMAYPQKPRPSPKEIPVWQQMTMPGWVNVDEIIAMDDHNKRVKARQLKKDRR